ncbi:MAG: hypothetical protein NVS2B7_06660 [Herpetosiphon sp.]
MPVEQTETGSPGKRSSTFDCAGAIQLHERVNVRTRPAMEDQATISLGVQFSLRPHVRMADDVW